MFTSAVRRMMKSLGGRSIYTHRGGSLVIHGKNRRWMGIPRRGQVHAHSGRSGMAPLKARARTVPTKVILQYGAYAHRMSVRCLIRAPGETCAPGFLIMYFYP